LRGTIRAVASAAARATSDVYMSAVTVIDECREDGGQRGDGRRANRFRCSSST
jgi:hypothetical protein